MTIDRREVLRDFHPRLIALDRRLEMAAMPRAAAVRRSPALGDPMPA